MAAWETKSPFSTWRHCSRDVKTRIRHRDWLKLAGEKTRRKQVGTRFLLFCLFARTSSPSGKRALVLREKKKHEGKL